jgi:plastocyanin
MTAVKKLLAVTPIALLLAAACGGGGTNPTGSPAPTGGSPAPSEPAAAVVCLPDDDSGDVTANIVDFAFDPTEVTATAGQVVAWTNTGQAPHTVTFDDGPDCGRANAGGTVAAQFNEPGEYSFHCTIHPTMVGTVRVDQ